MCKEAEEDSEDEDLQLVKVERKSRRSPRRLERSVPDPVTSSRCLLPHVCFFSSPRAFSLQRTVSVLVHFFSGTLFEARYNSIVGFFPFFFNFFFLVCLIFFTQLHYGCFFEGLCV